MPRPRRGKPFKSPGWPLLLPHHVAQSKQLDCCHEKTQTEVIVFFFSSFFSILDFSHTLFLQYGTVQTLFWAFILSVFAVKYKNIHNVYKINIVLTVHFVCWMKGALSLIGSKNKTKQQNLSLLRETRRVQDPRETFNKKKSHRLNSLLFLASWFLNRGDENVKEDTVVRNIHLYIKAPFCNTFPFKSSLIILQV